MNTLAQELRHKHATGVSIPQDRLLEMADSIEKMAVRNAELEDKVSQLHTSNTLFTTMLAVALDAVGSTRSVDDIREEVLAGDVKRDSYLYNAYEVRNIIRIHDRDLDEMTALKVAYDQVNVEDSKRSVKQVMDAINNNQIGPFSFQEVAAWTEYLRKNSISRPPRKNLKEIFDLLKSNDQPPFYWEEVRMLRQWGSDLERSLDGVKRKLGRAFLAPIGYTDPRYDMIISAACKKGLLNNRSLSSDAFQHAVFTRPDYLLVDQEWYPPHGPQLHAGPHFHTKSNGTWWCGTQFQELKTHELMRILEEALGELRLLYLHFHKETTNEAE